MMDQQLYERIEAEHFVHILNGGAHRMFIRNPNEVGGWKVNELYAMAPRRTKQLAERSSLKMRLHLADTLGVLDAWDGLHPKPFLELPAREQAALICRELRAFDKGRNKHSPLVARWLRDERSGKVATGRSRKK